MSEVVVVRPSVAVAVAVAVARALAAAGGMPRVDGLPIGPQRRSLVVGETLLVREVVRDLVVVENHVLRACTSPGRRVVRGVADDELCQAGVPPLARLGPQGRCDVGARTPSAAAAGAGPMAIVHSVAGQRIAEPGRCLGRAWPLPFDERTSSRGAVCARPRHRVRCPGWPPSRQPIPGGREDLERPRFPEIEPE